MKSWMLVVLLFPPAAGLAALPPSSERGPRAQVLRVETRAGGYLGAALEDVSAEEAGRLKLAAPGGVRVADIEDDSPAARAGLKRDDVLLRFAGESVRSAAQFRRLVRETPPGRKVELELSRDGSVRTLALELGRRGDGAARDDTFEFSLPELGALDELEGLPELRRFTPDAQARRFTWRDFGRGTRGFAPLAPGEKPRLGLSYQAIGGQLARYFKLEAESGLLVTEVDSGGAADQAGLRAGDVLLAFDGQALSTERDLRRAVHAAQAGKALRVQVWREGRKLDLTVTLPAEDAGDERGQPL